MADAAAAEQGEAEAAEADGSLMVSTFLMACVFLGLCISMTDPRRSGSVSILLEIIAFCFLFLATLWEYLRRLDVASGGGITDCTPWMGIALRDAGTVALALATRFIAWSSQGSSSLRIGTTVTLSLTAAIAVCSCCYTTFPLCRGTKAHESLKECTKYDQRTTTLV